MQLLINGDSHAAGAEAVNSYAFAEDDPRYFYQGRAPHPDNELVSWGYLLHRPLKARYTNISESASSNQRIIRTTKEYIDQYQFREELFIVIGWSTWERQEWLIDGTYYQVNASGIDDVPESHQQKYKEFVVNVNWEKCTNDAHRDIWNFHEYLNQKNIKHIFFNCNSHFSDIRDRKDWGLSYINPYDYNETYDKWLTNQGYLKVNPNSYHFGPDAHKAWQKKLLRFIIDNKIV